MPGSIALQPRMNNHIQEFRKRLRIGVALIAGYFSGTALGQVMGHHVSEFFTLGFLAGALLTQTAFWLVDRGRNRGSRSGES